MNYPAFLRFNLSLKAIKKYTGLAYSIPAFLTFPWGVAALKPLSPVLTRILVKISSYDSRSISDGQTKLAQNSIGKSVGECRLGSLKKSPLLTLIIWVIKPRNFGTFQLLNNI